MINTLIWRLKEAWGVIIGKKITQKKFIKSSFSEISVDTQPLYQFKDSQLEAYIKSKKIEFVFSEFNENRVNAGGSEFNLGSRLDPSLSSLRKFFPDAQYTVYSDFDLNIEGVQLKKVENPVLQDKTDHPRHFYHLADYYKFKGMLDSDADIVVSIDSDMFIWSENIYRLIYLTEKFGYCIPSSSGRSMNFEVETSMDTIPIRDESNGFGVTCNITPMSLSKNSDAGRKYYEMCCQKLEEEPSRASIAMWKAAWETGLIPYFLPKEFCVVRGLEGMGHEVLLHIGHPEVAKYYNIKI